MQKLAAGSKSGQAWEFNPASRWLITPAPKPDHAPNAGCTRQTVWQILIAMNAFSSLEKMLDPTRPCFTAETAANIVQIEPDAAKTARMEELAAKANEGRLARYEESEYWSCIYAGKMMSILKLQARLFLKRQAA